MRGRDRIALAIAAITMVVAAIALGGAARWAVCLTSALAGVGAAIYVTSAREIPWRSPLLAVIGVAIALTALQIVPLPAVIVELVSPAKHALVAEHARALDEAPPSWMPLSLDPPATLVELAKLCGWFLFAYVALRIGATTNGRPWLARGVAIIAAAVAVLTLAHLAVGASAVYGLYTPRGRGGTIVAPFLNGNHLAALMALAVPIAIGFAIHETSRRRLLWVGVALLCLGVGFLAESRGGALALVVGVTALGALVALQRRRGARDVTPLRRSDAIAIGIALVSAVVLVGVLAAGGLLEDLAQTRLGEIDESASKFGAWRTVPALVTEYPWLGIGRGAYAAASTAVHDSRAFHFTHLENEYLQLVVDWGIVGAAALLLTLVWLATEVGRRGRASAWEAGVVAGLLALAVEVIFDFSLWMPGIAYAAIAAAAAVAFRPTTTLPSRSRARAKQLRVAVIAALAIPIALAATPLGRDARTETEDLAAERAGRTPAERFAHARAVLARHPSDYVAAALTADALFALRDRRAVPVANRALLLHPTSGDTHRLVARMLLASGHREQAMTEYALSMRYAPTADLYDEIVRVFPEDADLIRALPLDASMVREGAHWLLNHGRPRTALAYLRRYLSFHPDDVAVLLNAADVALRVGEPAQAVELARRAHGLEASADATAALGRGLVAAGQARDAIAVMTRAIDQPSRPHGTQDRIDLLVALAAALESAGELDGARARLLAAAEAASGPVAAEIYRKIAEIEEKSGNKHQADWARQRAKDLER